MFLIKHFVASSLHLGHKTNKWNPRTSNFILGMRDGIFIIDLEQTLIMIKRALTFIKKVCLKRGYIFYIPSFIQNESFFIKNNTKSLENPLIKKRETNLIFLYPEFFSSSKQRGMLYAWTQKRQNLYTLSLDKNELENKIQLNPNLNTSNLFFKPEVLFILEINANTTLIKEALKLQIPIVSILDSNSNTYGIQYPIPGNNDTLEAQKLYTELLINTIIDAKKTEIKLIT